MFNFAHYRESGIGNRTGRKVSEADDSKNEKPKVCAGFPWAKVTDSQTAVDLASRSKPRIERPPRPKTGMKPAKEARRFRFLIKCFSNPYVNLINS
jgi:hypothetical protein